MSSVTKLIRQEQAIRELEGRLVECEKEFARQLEHLVNKTVEQRLNAIRKAMVPQADVCRECVHGKACRKTWKEHPSFQCNAIQNLSNAYHLLRHPEEKVLEGLASSSDKLSEQEIADIEASEREIKEGKAKTFESAEELIKDLHRGRKRHLAFPDKTAEKERKKS